MSYCKAFNIFTRRTLEAKKPALMGFVDSKLSVVMFYITYADFEVLTVSLIEKVRILCYTINRQENHTQLFFGQ